MDQPIETFMRDVASDIGKSMTAVAENTRQRLALFVKMIRKDAEPAMADAHEVQFLSGLESRVAEEIGRYRDTSTEQHLQVVLATVHQARPQ